MSAILRQFAPKEDKHKPKTRPPLTHKPMLLQTRGSIRQHAQVFENLRDLIPHAKREQSMNSKDFHVLDEIAADRFCDTIGAFETRHKKVSSECYFWIANCPSGPSINFFVRDAQSIESLRLTIFAGPEHTGILHTVLREEFRRAACSKKLVSLALELAGSLEHVDLLFGRTGRQQNILLRNAIAYGKHGLEHGT